MRLYSSSSSSSRLGPTVGLLGLWRQAKGSTVGSQRTMMKRCLAGRSTSRQGSNLPWPEAEFRWSRGRQANGHPTLPRHSLEGTGGADLSSSWSRNRVVLGGQRQMKQALGGDKSRDGSQVANKSSTRLDSTPTLGGPPLTQ